MGAPWEKYQAAPAGKPWEKYQQTPAEPEAWSNNPLVGAFQTAANMGAGATDFVGNAIQSAGDAIEGVVPPAVTDALTPDFMRVENPLKVAAEGVRGDVENLYAPTVEWGDVKADPSIGNIATFGVEQGISSLPHMFAAANPFAYVVSRAGELGDTRAENKGLETSGLQENVEAVPGAIASLILDRIGLKGATGATNASAQALKQAIKAPAAASAAQAGKAIIGAGAKETVTEFGQEQIDYATEVVGTKKPWELAQSIDRGLAGAVGGGVSGAGIRTAVETVKAVGARRNKAAEDVTLEDIQEDAAAGDQEAANVLRQMGVTEEQLATMSPDRQEQLAGIVETRQAEDAARLDPQDGTGAKSGRQGKNGQWTKGSFQADQDRLAAERDAVEAGDIDPAAASTAGRTREAVPDVMPVSPEGQADAGDLGVQAGIDNANQVREETRDEAQDAFDKADIQRRRGEEYTEMRQEKEGQFAADEHMAELERRIEESPTALVQEQLEVTPEQFAGLPAGAREQLVAAAQKKRADTKPGETLNVEGSPAETEGFKRPGETGTFDPAQQPMDRGQREGYATNEAPNAPQSATRGTPEDQTAAGGGERPFKGFGDDIPQDQRDTFQNRAEQKAEAERQRAAEELEAEWTRRRNEEASRRAENDRARNRTNTKYDDTAFTNEPGEPDANGFHHVNDDGIMTDKDGRPVKFKNSKEAAKWAAKNGQGGYFDRVVAGSNTDEVYLRARDAYHADKKTAQESGAAADARNAEQSQPGNQRGLPGPEPEAQPEPEMDFDAAPEPEPETNVEPDVETNEQPLPKEPKRPTGARRTAINMGGVRFADAVRHGLGKGRDLSRYIGLLRSEKSGEGAKWDQLGEAFAEDGVFGPRDEDGYLPEWDDQMIIDAIENDQLSPDEQADYDAAVREFEQAQEAHDRHGEEVDAVAEEAGYDGPDAEGDMSKSDFERMWDEYDEAEADGSFQDSDRPESASENEGEGAEAGSQRPEDGEGTGADSKSLDGEQEVIPGAEKISDKEFAERQMEQPMRGGNEPVGGMFDMDARNQTDIMDMMGAAEVQPDKRKKAAQRREKYNASRDPDVVARELEEGQQKIRNTQEEHYRRGLDKRKERITPTTADAALKRKRSENITAINQNRALRDKHQEVLNDSKENPSKYSLDSEAINDGQAEFSDTIKNLDAKIEALEAENQAIEAAFNDPVYQEYAAEVEGILRQFIDAGDGLGADMAKHALVSVVSKPANDALGFGDIPTRLERLRKRLENPPDDSASKEAERKTDQFWKENHPEVYKRIQDEYADVLHVDGESASKPKKKSGDGSVTLGMNPFFDPDIYKGISKDLKALLKATTALTSTATRPIRRIVRSVMSSSDQAIRSDLKERGLLTPTAKKILDMFNAEAGKGDGVGETFFSGIERRVGEQYGKLDKALGRFRDDEKAMKKIVQLLRGNPRALRPGSPIHDAAIAVRKILDEHLEYLKEAGVDIGEVKNGYFPREMDSDAILKDPGGFLTAAAKAYREIGLDAKAAREAAKQLHDEIIYGHMNGHQGGASAPFVKSRVFSKKVDDANHPLNKFLVDDPVSSLSQYINRAAKRAEIARRFGDNFKDIGEMEQALIDEGAGEAFHEIGAHIGSMTGTAPHGMSDGAIRVFQNIRMWSALMYLERATLSSLGEIIMPAVRSGNLADVGTAITEALKGFKKKNKSEAREFAEDLGLITGHLGESIMAARYAGEDIHGQKTSKILDRYFRRIGLEQFTEATRIASTKIGNTFLRRLAKDISKRGDNKVSMDLLAELGIPADKAKDFAAWMNKSDGFPTDLNGEMGDLYKTAIWRFLDQTIMRPNKAMKPKAANHPLGQVVYHLQAFTLSFYQNVMKRSGRMAKRAVSEKGLSMHDRARLMAPAMMLPVLYGFQAAISELRDELTMDPERREKETGSQKAFKWMSRAGMFGAADPWLNMLEASSRYQRGAADSLAGPGLGSVAKGIDATVALLGNNSPNTNTQERKAMRALYDVGIEPLFNYIVSSRVGPASGIITKTGAAALTQFVGSGRSREQFLENTVGGYKKTNEKSGPKKLKSVKKLKKLKTL